MSNQSPLTFEPATEKDVEAFLELERKVVEARLYSPIFDKEAAHNEIRKNTLFLIKKDGTIAGMAAYRKQPDGTVYICHVNVNPAHQRQGIARAAMAFIMEENNGARGFNLVTHPENKKALKLYQSLGFRIEGQKDNYFGDGEPRVILTRAA